MMQLYKQSRAVVIMSALCALTMGCASTGTAENEQDSMTTSEESAQMGTTSSDPTLEERVRYYERTGGDPQAAERLRERGPNSAPSLSGQTEQTQQMSEELKYYEKSGGDPAAAERRREAIQSQPPATGDGASEKAQAITERLNEYERRGGSPGGASGQELEANDTSTNPDR